MTSLSFKLFHGLTAGCGNVSGNSREEEGDANLYVSIANFKIYIKQHFAWKKQTFSVFVRSQGYTQ